MCSIEHIKIGKHVFPLYSHPLYRAEIQENTYVTNQIDRHMRNPRLLAAIDGIVERLIEEGVTGNVSEEDVAFYLEEALGRLDMFLDEETNNEGKEAVPLQGTRSAPSRASPVLLSSSPVLPPLSEKAKQSKPRQTVRKLPRRLLHSKQSRSLTNAPSTEAVIPSLPSPVMFSSRTLMEVDETPKRCHVSMPPHMTEGQTSDWRKAARSLFYSRLSLRLEDVGNVLPEEMEMRSGKKGLMKLQGAELRNLSAEAYSLLDVTMDGNSSAISYRPRLPMSILQHSHALVSTQPITPSTNALGKRAHRLLARPLVSTRGETTMKGATAGHEWTTETKTRSKQSTYLDLPQATYRSRVGTNPILRKFS